MYKKNILTDKVIAKMAKMPKSEIPGYGRGYISMATLGKMLREEGINLKEFGFEKPIVFFKSTPKKFGVEFVKNHPYVCVKEGIAANSQENVYHQIEEEKMVMPTSRISSSINHLNKTYYIGDIEKCICALSSMVHERMLEKCKYSSNFGWEYRLGLPVGDFPNAYKYIDMVFCRQLYLGNIRTSEDGDFVAFNTGLMDFRGEEVIILFAKNKKNTKFSHKFVGFCVQGEDCGKILNTNFVGDFPRPTFKDHCKDFTYDVAAGAPIPDSRHILCENVDRLPHSFLIKFGPRNFVYDCPDNPEKREDYYAALREAIENDGLAYRRLIGQLNAAISNTMNKLEADYRTAVPFFNPKTDNGGSIQLLLPLYLDDYEYPICLVVSKTKTGKYSAPTILTIEQAYPNARVISSLQNTWMDAEK